MQQERMERNLRTEYRQQHRVRGFGRKARLATRSNEEGTTPLPFAPKKGSRKHRHDSFRPHFHFTPSPVTGGSTNTDQQEPSSSTSLSSHLTGRREASFLHRTRGASSPSPHRFFSSIPSSSSVTSSTSSTLSSSFSSSSSSLSRTFLPETVTTMASLPRRPPVPPVRGRGTGVSSLPSPLPTIRPQIVPPWKHWESLAVNLSNVPKEVNTFILWQTFSVEGNIFSIDLYEDSHGNREPKGKIRFRPPPRTDFWRSGTYTLILADGKPTPISIALDARHQSCAIPSSIRQNVSYPAEITLPLQSLDVGIMFDETTLLPLRNVGSTKGERGSVTLDLKRKAMFIHFQLPIFNSLQKPATTAQIFHEYRIKIPFSQLTQIFQARNTESGVISHLTILDSPPLYHRRIKNIASTFTDDSTWRNADTWFRQTYVVHNPQELAGLPISLRKMKPIIDIGRWNAFQITYPKDSYEKGKLKMLCDALSDYNITVEDTDRFTQWDESKEKIPPVWKWIDQSPESPKSSLEDLINETYVPLPFSVRYQLEVCISNGFLSEFTMTREFVVKLSELGEIQARKLLEYVATKKQVYHDPMNIFSLKFIKGVTDSKIPAYCCYMRAARITPSTIYFNTPTVEISNRVIRYFMEYADRFLRVRFTDEKLLGRINSTVNNTMDEVFTRIKRTLANGIVVGDRHYEFLAFGNSQFREHGAYFFAPLPNLTAANIRAWMGHFNDIRNVAKHAARLGQCFSTTRAISGCPVYVRKINDVARNGFSFSDGVGRISKFLAQMAASELKINTPTGDPPSAFQFRLGGCKGMLTVFPEAQPQEVHIRKSQYKFHAAHNGLEIIRWSQFSMATLNRQLIIVLSSLGILDGVFHSKLKTMLTSLDEAMESDPPAIYFLKKYVDPNQMTLTISQMVLDGFRRSKEPFLTSILTLWRAWHLKYLKEKAKIAIDQGANLLGCMDETGTLKGFFKDSIPDKDASHEEKLAALPEVFVQVSRPENGGKYEVIKGPCILARNPSLHPGDIRVVKAVNVPALNHLRDVVVLPQTGDRDIAGMCSGGDLDGDDYLVIWDPDLLPKDWFRMPMTYTSNKAKDLDHDVTVDEITSFFVTYMKNDCLPRIAHAHLAWADRLEDGVNEEKCIRLAQLHSDAVDYNKTGNPAIMTRSLQPRVWPHFMEKKNKTKDQIYRSRKILGQLYEAVERVDYVPNLEMPFDNRILECGIEVSEDLMNFAKALKSDYDSAMRRIMTQHEIKTEFEVWSTFVLSHANMSKDYKFHEELGTISTSLREGFRKECYDKVGGRSFQLLAPLATAMYRVAHEEMTAALKRHGEENSMDKKLFHKPTPEMNQLPLISFPWIFPHILGKIAMAHYERPEGPVDTIEIRDDFDNHRKKTHHFKAGNAASKPAAIHMVQGDSDDPFGLFEGDLDFSAQSGTEPAPAGRMILPGASVETLDQLADFGFAGTPKSLPSSFTSPSPAPANTDADLLELDDSSKQSGIIEEVVEDTVTKQIEVAVGGDDEDVECLDIVEEKVDVKPNALDMLNDLLGN